MTILPDTCPHCGEPLKAKARAPNKRASNNPWTDEREDLLRKLWAKGASCSEIAEALGGGLSRNAVIGKVHRLGLASRTQFQRKPEPVKRRRKPSGPRLVRVAPHPSGFKKTPGRGTRRPKPELPPVVPILGPVAFLDRPMDRCAFIADDPKAQPIDTLLCCGESVRPGSSYCPHHFARTSERYVLPADAATYREKAAA